MKIPMISQDDMFFCLAGPLNLFFRCVLTILFLGGMVVLLLDLLSTMCSHQAICGQRSEDSGVVAGCRWKSTVDQELHLWIPFSH